MAAKETKKRVVMAVPKVAAKKQASIRNDLVDAANAIVVVNLESQNAALAFLAGPCADYQTRVKELTEDARKNTAAAHRSVTVMIRELTEPVKVASDTV